MEIRGFLVGKINDGIPHEKTWSRSGDAGGLQAAEFFDPSPTGTMAAAATANGCGIFVMLNAGLALTGSVGNCTRG